VVDSNPRQRGIAMRLTMATPSPSRARPAGEAVTEAVVATCVIDPSIHRTGRFVAGSGAR
jgi:hypothetical protein